MRRAVLLALLVALGATGAAYAASNITNQYVIKPFTVSPKKSGTKAHPASIGTTVAYTVRTLPKGNRPNVVKSETITIQGVRANSNAFPTCSSSRLIDPTEGPGTCPKGSLVGTGYFKAEIGPSGNQAAPNQLNCRVDLSVYNSGNNHETYYLYLKPGQAGECPNTGTLPVAMTANLSEKSGNLVQKFTLPTIVRHPAAGFDSAPTFATLTTKNQSRKVKGKKVAALESISCPANHSRQIAIKFTLENGTSRTSTRNTACS